MMYPQLDNKHDWLKHTDACNALLTSVQHDTILWSTDEAYFHVSGSVNTGSADPVDHTVVSHSLMASHRFIRKPVMMIQTKPPKRGLKVEFFSVLLPRSYLENNAFNRHS
ncbi:uncharacterized protein LOC120350511 [Nilaparvata lugens]|uniref:uncharacterized protein LOC120350511 n=1 Tax=Nilaparvata lugens TaxID=108931 RepID=UPI00193D1B00|nr:uncharacterized protein LOC120350511 [Nilaparvata lugens]